MHDADFVSYLTREAAKKAALHLHLGEAVIGVSSNDPGFNLAKRFSRSILTAPSGTSDFKLRCISTDRTSLEASWIASETRPLLGGGGADESDGRIRVVGRTYYLFGSGRLEPLVWTFFTRFFLTVHSFESGALHLKAGAVCPDNAVLLVGASGAGKTFLLSRLCHAGAAFVTNTHSVLAHGSVTGIGTKLGVRPDDRHLLGSTFDERVREGGAAKLYVDPARLSQSWQSRQVVEAICIVDHRPMNGNLISAVDLDTMQNYCEQFALPINCYKLDDELFEHFGRDPLIFSRAYAEMKLRLRENLKRLRKFRIGADVSDPEALSIVSKTLFGRQ